MMTNGSLFSSICKKSQGTSLFFKKSNFHCPLVAVTSYRLPSVGFPIVANNLPSSSNEPPLLAAPGVVHKLGTALKRSNDETKGWKKKKRKTKQKQRGKKSCRTRETWRVLFLGHLICIYGHRLCRHYYY